MGRDFKLNHYLKLSLTDDNSPDRDTAFKETCGARDAYTAAKDEMMAAHSNPSQDR